MGSHRQTRACRNQRGFCKAASIRYVLGTIPRTFWGQISQMIPHRRHTFLNKKPPKWKTDFCAYTPKMKKSYYGSQKRPRTIWENLTKPYIAQSHGSRTPKSRCDVATEPHRGQFIGHFHNIRYMHIAGHPQARVPVRTLYGLPLLCAP